VGADAQGTLEACGHDGRWVVVARWCWPWRDCAEQAFIRSFGAPVPLTLFMSEAGEGMEILTGEQSRLYQIEGSVGLVEALSKGGAGYVVLTEAGVRSAGQVWRSSAVLMMIVAACMGSPVPTRLIFWTDQ